MSETKGEFKIFWHDGYAGSNSFVCTVYSKEEAERNCKARDDIIDAQGLEENGYYWYREISKIRKVNV